ncbi:MAG: sulfotransferase [Pseudolabrys sp.]
MTIDTIPAPQNALGQFRALVMADEALADSLSRTFDAEDFAGLAMSAAGRHGIALAADTIKAEVRPDPLGLTRWAAAPESGSASASTWPPRHWLPIHVIAHGRQIFVDWANFGSQPLTAPFFEDDMRRARSLPFNRLFGYRMTLGDFLKGAADAQSLQPAGFIFHMSRCGSTLVSQMLAALPRNIAISEAAPIDAAVQICRTSPDLPAKQQDELLAAMIAAYGRQRAGCERHYFIKLDCWHALALPLFRRAFPKVPWVFLYRDPVEVMVSQLRELGSQMVPEIVPPSLYGIDNFDAMPSEEYAARVLAKICRMALENIGGSGGLAVNYRELPQAIWTRILPHFGIAFDAVDRELMNAAARNDAKAPHFAFSNDSDAKQRQASGSIRALAERHLGEVYRQLEDLRNLT